MISYLHDLRDDRIYWKEALSLKKIGYRVIHIGLGAEKKDFITPEGIRLIQLEKKVYCKKPLADKLFRLFTFRKKATSALFDLAKTLNADCYHFHDVQIHAIGRRLKELPQRPKVIYDVHESYGDLIRDHSTAILRPFNYFYSRYIERWEMKNARFYDAIITTEKYVYDRFKKEYPAKTSLILYNYSYFLPQQDETGNRDKRYDAIYSGAISEVRGIFEILETVRLLKDELPSVKVLVIGPFTSEKLKDQVLSRIEKQDLVNNLIIHEPVPFEKIGDFYSASKIGLGIFHPITLYQNAVFIKTFEYMAYGLPVVCSNFGTIAHYITLENAGIAVDPLKPASISEAVLKILNSPALYETYSRNGFQAVREKYNWQKEAVKLLNLYETMLSKFE